MTLHIGFTGSRHGMSHEQRGAVQHLVATLAPEVDIFHAHHGDCIGADEAFHHLCRDVGSRAYIEAHPMTPGGLRAHCQGDVVHPAQPHARRNAAIVAASDIMIAAPFEAEPKRRGGTWMTIRMAMRAVRAGKLRQLYVVGRDGRLMEWEGWK